MNNFQTLISNGLSLLRLSSYEWFTLEKSKARGRQFTLIFPHEMAASAKKQSLVLILVSSEYDGNTDAFYYEVNERTNLALMVGFVKSRQPVSTFESRVSFSLVSNLQECSIQELLLQIPESNLKASIKRLTQSESKFEKVSEKLSRRLVEVILQNRENLSALLPIVWQMNAPKTIANASAMQIDAIKIALKAFGATETEAVELHFSNSDTALAGIRLQEDSVIEHDARELAGWTLNRSKATGWARFTRAAGRASLEIYTANKRPLEELFGVDLIYFNKTRRSLVMVQYKMLEESQQNVKEDQYEDTEWTVRIDSQFRKELAKMTLFDRDLDPNGAYRLNPTSFFFKLVKRNSDIKSAGIILSREHLQSLLQSNSLTGPKGGLKISYKELDGHYIRSGCFTELIRSGYIGSRGATTDRLETLMHTALAEGRAVVAAIQSVLPYDPIRRSLADDDFQPIEVNEDLAPDLSENEED